MQWDSFGTHLLHMDLTRVSADERLTVEVTVILRGESPGVKDGGHLEQFAHTVEVECLAVAIPEKLEVDIGDDAAMKAAIDSLAEPN